MTLALSQRSVPARATRVVVIDDSAVVRGFLSRWVEDAHDLEMAGMACDGVEGIAIVTATQPDVVVLDIEMPKLDGLQALPGILRAAPHCRVLVSSRLTVSGARICLQCLEQGAADVIGKPAFQKNLGSLSTFRQDLIGKIRGLSSKNVTAVQPGSQRSKTQRDKATDIPEKKTVTHSVLKSSAPQVVLIGASTGGPQAIGEFLSAAGPILAKTPIVIVQHMPGIFTSAFAEHIVRTTGFAAQEAVHGELLKPGTVYVAPGGRHTSFAGRALQARFVISDEAPIRFSRPSIDRLLESAATAFGARAWCVLLTGMGEDGLLGTQTIAAVGGQVYAQDEVSSVVWGIPGSVVRAGLAHVTDTPVGLALTMRTMIAGVRT